MSASWKVTPEDFLKSPGPSWKVSPEDFLGQEATPASAQTALPPAPPLKPGESRTRGVFVGDVPLQTEEPVAAKPAGPSPTAGLLTPGNIDLHSRPVVHNGDGSISTVRSASFEQDGKQVLVPTVADDGSRILSNGEAWDQYRKTGKHLGIFDTPDNATAYSQQLHQDQAKEYAPPTGPTGLIARGKAPALAPTTTASPESKPDSMNATISARQPGFWESLTAPVREGAIGRAFGVSTETAESQRQDPSNPLLRFDAALPNQQPGALRGTAQFASGLTRPESLLIMGGTAGIGALEGALGRTGLSKLVSLGFSSQMLWDAVKQAPEFASQIKAGDWGGATETLTKIGLGATMAALGVKHGMAADVRAPEVTDKMRRDLEKPYQETTPPGPPGPVMNPAQRRATAVPPETGVPENVDRAQVEREAIIGKPRDWWTNSDILAADELRARGYSGAGGDLSAPGAVDPAPVPQRRPMQRRAMGPPVAEQQAPAGDLSAPTPLEPPAGPPTAAQPTVPESPDTLQIQMTQLNQGKRQVVMFPKGTPVPDMPHGTPTHQDAFGNTYAYDPERIQPAMIDDAVASNRLPEILGDASVGMGAPDKSQLQGSPTAVVVRSMDGTTVQATATDEANLQATIDAGKKVMPPGGTVSVEPAENEIAARQGQPAPSPTPATEALPPPEAASNGTEVGTSVPAAPEEAAPAPPPDSPATPAPDPVKAFLSDETGTSSLGALLMEDVNQTKALAAKRKAALAEIERAKNTPEETAFGQKILQWFTGERDLWGARVNQLMDGLRKMVPDHVDQEALSLMRDFKNRPGEMQQWLDGTHPTLAAITDPAQLAVARNNIERLRPAIERALDPTPQMLSADRLLTQLADVSLREGQRHGFLESSITPDEYVTHLLHPKDEATYSPLTERAASKMGGKIGRRFAFAEKRSYPTLLDAVADNVKPRTLNAFDAFTIHGDKFATARATHMLVQQLKDAGIGKWGGHAGTAPGGVPQTNFTGAPGIPADWVEIAPHAHPFQNQVSYLDAGGEPASARQTLFVPKSIEKALRPITDPDYTSKIAGFTKLRMFQAYTKAAQLGMSLFHATTENYMAMANMGPKGWIRGLRADRDSMGFREQERDFIVNGGTTSIQGKTYDAYKSLQPGSIPTWGDIWKAAPGVREMDRLAQGVTDFTFGRIQRQFKVTDYAIHKAGWIAEHPSATPAEQSAAMQSIAKEINAVYGGLHWENLGVNRMTLNVARAIMLAPDWTFSNLVNLKYATERGTPAGQLARAFWLRTAVGGIAATQALSLLVSGKPSKRLTQVYLGNDKDGQEIYQNVFFKGASGDVVNLVNNVGDYGAVMGLSRSMMGKAAPVLRTGLQLGTNRNYLGQQIVPKGLDPFAGTARGVYAAAQGLSPIPLSFQNAKDMLIGPHADRYTTPEWFTTAFAGTPPSHVPPEGMKMTKNGLRVKQERPADTIWQQIKTGKRAAPKPDLSAPGPVN